MNRPDVPLRGRERERAMANSRNALVGPTKRVAKGLVIYKVRASPFYRARASIPTLGRKTLTTKETTQVGAIKAALEWYGSLATSGALLGPSKERTFEFFADRLIEAEKSRGEHGGVHKRLWQSTRFYLRHDGWGLLHRFGSRDVTTLKPRDFTSYKNWVKTVAPDLTPSSLNHLADTFSKVLKFARAEGVIDAIPHIEREKRKDNPRPFFQFHPLVEERFDEYRLILRTAKEMAAEGVRVRETIVTAELYEFILFMAHSFLRPAISEVYALTHRDVVEAAEPTRLMLTIRQGKTGQRRSNTLKEAVYAYRRLCAIHTDHGPDDYIFLPRYSNRGSALRVMQRQFNALLDRCGLKFDKVTGLPHTVYSLRHTAFCMRIILSRGRVNIYNLAKNAGTTVDQIERFYSRRLPLSAEMAENLQTFGESELEQELF